MRFGSDGFGATIDGARVDRLLEPGTVRTIGCLLATHRVVVVRCDREPDDAQLVGFASQFGPLIDAGGRTLPGGDPHVIGVITDERSGRPALGSSWPAAGLPWHQDHSGLRSPAAISVLTAHELPDADQGATVFADLVQAWSALDDELRHLLSTRSVRYPLPGAHRSGGGHPIRVTAPMTIEHPVSATTVPWLGPGYATVIDSAGDGDGDSDGDGDESGTSLRDALLRAVVAARPHVRHHWRIGDVVVFDNLAVLHSREPVDPASRRVMRQVSVRSTIVFDTPAIDTPLGIVGA